MRPLNQAGCEWITPLVLDFLRLLVIDLKRHTSHGRAMCRVIPCFLAGTDQSIVLLAFGWGSWVDGALTGWPPLFLLSDLHVPCSASRTRMLWGGIYSRMSCESWEPAPLTRPRIQQGLA
jgi:hypothetical protein